MRRFIFAGMTSLGLFAAAHAHAENVALYRFYDSFNHFYTTACGVKPPQGEYCYSGIEGYLSSTAAPDTKPLSRLFNGVYYLYTWDDAEKATALANGYKDEGVEGYVSTKGGAGKTPLYRSWHANVGDRFLSIDQKEAEGGIPKDINPDVYGPLRHRAFRSAGLRLDVGQEPMRRPPREGRKAAGMHDGKIIPFSATARRHGPPRSGVHPQ